MAVTIQVLLPGTVLDSGGNVVPINDIGARIYDRSTPTIVETVNTVTRSADGTFSFVPASTNFLPTQLYEIALFEKSSGETLSLRSPVWIETNNGTYSTPDYDAMARYGMTKLRNLEAVKRTILDTNPIVFEWPVGASATITGTKRFNASPATVPLVATPTFIRTRSDGTHEWSLPYNVADRLTSEGTVLYELVDNTTPANRGFITLAITHAQQQSIAAPTPGGWVFAPPVGLNTLEIKTLHELVHRLTARSGGDASQRNQFLFTRAIQDAIRGLTGKHEWRYYRRQARFNTSPAFTATVDYDATDKTLTISGTGTWPADAALGEVYYGDKAFRVATRTSDTVIVLDGEFAPSDDFSDVSVTWVRRAYYFSREVSRMHAMVNITNNREVKFLPSSDFQNLSYSRRYGGITTYFTIQNHGSRYGATDIVLLPPPELAEIFEVTATVVPVVPKQTLISGNDAIPSGNTIVCGTASFRKDLIGSIIRLSPNTTPPTYYDSENYEFQAFITDVPTSTSLTISEPTGITTARGYAISSPIDIDVSVMLECLEDEAYFQYCKNHDHKSLAMASQVAKSSLREAICRDNNRVSLDSRAWDSWNWPYWGGSFIPSQSYTSQ